MKNIKILICDDSDMIRSLIRTALRDLGYENVFETVNGEDALILLKIEHEKQSPFNLIFIDLNMPIKNGLEVIKTCKNDPIFSNIPFVMISGERDHKNIAQALNYGVVDYIMKPFPPAILENKITKILEQNKTT